MSEIPQDVMSAARAILDDIEIDHPPVDGCGVYGSMMITIAARAILSERKRCADVARERMFDGHALAQATDIGRGCHLAASEIVEAIEATPCA